MKTIAVQTQTSEQVGIVIENNEIVEYISTRPKVKTLSGSIYLGKVSQINKGLQAAFIDFGEERKGFLRKEAIPWANASIERTLTEGQLLVVQVTKEPLGEKGAQLSADITIPGLLVIYQPFGKRVSVSKKMDSVQAGELKSLLNEQLHSDEGVIIRTAAAIVSVTTIMNEINQLRKQWKELLPHESAAKISKILEDPILPDQLIRKHPLSQVQEIILDDSQLSQSIKNRYPVLAEKVKWVKSISGYTGKSINEVQSQLIEPVARTEQGMELIIEHTEAMTVIDINSHKYKQKTLSSSHKLEMNKEAAKEVAKQIQLRNISGMILVDFISMQEKKHEKELLRFMNTAVKKDPVVVTIVGMTKLGLMEITRKRNWTNVIRELTAQQTPSFSKDTLLFRLERELLESVQSESALVAISPSLYELKKQLLSYDISSKIPQELFVRTDPEVTGWQIELEGSLTMIREAIKRRGYHVDNLF
ncbi:ribonuclease E/G [Halobacillus naozhouensis]|uniref:Ribonuclease E/G n=1 Tax=Halobacillus naozhouensis TaxID=554880 RepID=A0ABY8IXV3_9BACI|nr:ribonuclease E/G [Halobacillus naozhouensis]WFT73385.1 ribonuclease E/G [Halobacillus naozhouensis]